MQIVASIEAIERRFQEKFFSTINKIGFEYAINHMWSPPEHWVVKRNPNYKSASMWEKFWQSVEQCFWVAEIRFTPKGNKFQVNLKFDKTYKDDAIQLANYIEEHLKDDVTEVILIDNS